MNDDYVNGYIQRKAGGKYEGRIKVDGVDLSEIEGVYFKKDSKNYLWIKRKPVMQYDFRTGTYITRKSRPQFECYLEKQMDGNTVAYKGICTFLRYRYSVVGVWDSVFGREVQRLNLYVERLPMSEQTIINGISRMKRKQ